MGSFIAVECFFLAESYLVRNQLRLSYCGGVIHFAYYSSKTTCYRGNFGLVRFAFTYSVNTGKSKI